MKKIDLSQLITILANVGVIAGILFLGLELRQNNELMEIQWRGQMDSRRYEIVDLVIENPGLVELMGKDAGSLTQDEGDSLRMLGIRMLLNWEEQFRDVVAGRLDRDEALRGQRAVISRPRLNYGVPIAWETYRERADQAFIDWMGHEVFLP